VGDREELLAAVEARLERVATTSDPSSVLDPEALREAEQLLQAGAGQPGGLQVLDAVGWLYWYRYLALPEGQDQADLETAVRIFAPCFISGAGSPPGSLLPLLAQAVVPMATDQLGEISATKDESQISAAVDVWQRIADATPAGHPQQAEYLSHLGKALFTRFERTGRPVDLDAAISARQRAVDATPADHLERAWHLSDLGFSLRTRAQQTGSAADLDAAITVGQAAVDAAPPDDPDRAVPLANLGTALCARFAQTGTLADLDQAVLVDQEALDSLPAGHPNRAAVLSGLGYALWVRSGETGSVDDLDASVRASQAAADAISPDDPDRAAVLSNLGGALRARCDRTGALTDLDAAIDAFRSSVRSLPAENPNRILPLSNLADSLRIRFEWTGALANIDEAIEACRAAVTAVPAGHANRATLLANLSAALVRRFERTGALADVNAAVEAAQRAVAAMPPDQLYRGKSLAAVIAALQARFGRTGQLEDLQGLVKAAETAVAATPLDYYYRPMYQANLGVALSILYQQTGKPTDLDAAIETCQAGVAATPADELNRPLYLSNLASMLRLRFERTSASADLDDAVAAAGAAVAITPDDHPDRAAYLFNLGATLRARFDRTQTQADRDEAFSAYAQAAEVGSAPASIRIRAARATAPLAAESRSGRAADLLETAVRLLPQVTPRQLERADQQYAIGGFAGLANDAAAFALADTSRGTGERAARALGLLEAGRAVLLSRALDTRSDVSHLRREHPELAARFAELRDQLDQPEQITSPTPSLGPPGQAAEDRRHLAGGFAALLRQIRALEGFGSFGLPPSTDELLAEAASGPVVTFNVSAYRSDALLLTRDGITSLELPGLALEELTRQLGPFHQALRAASNPDADVPDPRAPQDKLLEILGWLWDVAAGPVLEALGYHQPPPPGTEWPRIWWAPGGLLGLLPIHAAGHHTEPLTGDQVRRTVMDRVISSWTPTTRALQYARGHVPAAAAGRALIVAMPVTPGLPGGGELPNVAMEVARVRALLPDTVLLAEASGQWTADSAGIPTRASVLSQLSRCPVAHFACHGFSDPVDPSRSRLFLHDHDSAPLTVASLAPVDLGQAQLAYLSACDTAATSTSGLLDEAIHLTTAFQLAGFPHVIGTLWEINDQFAVMLADTFYAALHTSQGTVDTSQAARALHDAVRAARDKHPRSPSLWAAYLHAGS
jgi:hypothetical protein